MNWVESWLSWFWNYEVVLWTQRLSALFWIFAIVIAIKVIMMITIAVSRHLHRNRR